MGEALNEGGAQDGTQPAKLLDELPPTLSLDNVANAVIIAYTYELPFGRGKRWVNQGGVLDYVIRRLERVRHPALQQRPAAFHHNEQHLWWCAIRYGAASGPCPGVVGYLNNNNSHFDITADRYLSPSGWAIPPNGRLGNSTRTDPVIRGWAKYNEDVSVFKNFRIWEPVNLRAGANFANVFNRHERYNPNTNFSDAANCGLVPGQCDVPRRIELYVELSF